MSAKISEKESMKFTNGECSFATVRSNGLSEQNLDIYHRVDHRDLNIIIKDVCQVRLWK